MSNSIFGRFRKKDNPIIEEEPYVLEDRTLWVEALQKIAYPVLSNLKSNNLKKNMPFESLDNKGRKFSYLAAFARVFNGIAPWLELGVDETDEGRIRERYINLTIRAIANAVNPNSEDYLLFSEPKQSLVDAAFFAQGLLRSKRQIWLNLPIDVQAKVINELKNTRIIAPYENHWLLFTSMIEATLLEFTGECDMERLRYGIRKFRQDWYIGDGLYADGSDASQDYLNSAVIHPMLNDILMVMRKYDIEEGEFLDRQLMRSSRLSSQLERMISPEGTYPVIGKSVAYRSGVFHTLAQISLFKILPRNIEPAQVRSALTKVIQNHFASNRNFDEDGWLTVGLNGRQIDISEPTMNTGSMYLCTAVFLPLGLSFNDPFWSSPFTEWSSLSAWNGHQVEKDQSIDF